MTRSPTTCVHDFICFLLFLLFLSMADGNQQLEDPSKDDFPNQQQNQPDVVEVTPSRKRAWPEVVGLTVEEAEKRIKEDMPEARFQVVPQDAFVTMDFNEGRVRLFVDSSNKLAKVPRVG